MSYCRWSSDNFTSDVYVYEHVDGSWTTHVAGRRYVGDVSPITDFKDAATWVAQSKAQSESLAKCVTTPIGLPSDGKTIKDDSPGGCADTLERLRAEGYTVPQYAIDELRAEQAELAAP